MQPVANSELASVEGGFGPALVGLLIVATLLAHCAQQTAAKQ